MLMTTKNVLMQCLRTLMPIICVFCDVWPNTKTAASHHQHTNTLSQPNCWSRDKTQAFFLENTLRKQIFCLQDWHFPQCPWKSFFFFFRELQPTDRKVHTYIPKRQIICLTHCSSQKVWKTEHRNNSRGAETMKKMMCGSGYGNPELPRVHLYWITGYCLQGEVKGSVVAGFERGKPWLGLQACVCVCVKEGWPNWQMRTACFQHLIELPLTFF